jgi:hypothetical protein
MKSNSQTDRKQELDAHWTREVRRFLAQIEGNNMPPAISGFFARPPAHQDIRTA